MKPSGPTPKTEKPSRYLKHKIISEATVLHVHQVETRKLHCWHDNIVNIILQIFPFKPHHEVYTVAVRMWPKFQIASSNESEDRDV